MNRCELAPHLVEVQMAEVQKIMGRHFDLCHQVVEDARICATLEYGPLAGLQDFGFKDKVFDAGQNSPDALPRTGMKLCLAIPDSYDFVIQTLHSKEGESHLVDVTTDLFFDDVVIYEPFGGDFNGFVDDLPSPYTDDMKQLFKTNYPLYTAQGLRHARFAMRVRADGSRFHPQRSWVEVRMRNGFFFMFIVENKLDKPFIPGVSSRSVEFMHEVVRKIAIVLQANRRALHNDVGTQIMQITADEHAAIEQARLPGLLKF